jgi:hypothetical protein
MRLKTPCSLLGLASLLFAVAVSAQTPKLIPVAEGWARNQINAVIFRRNSIVSHGNAQYLAFYDDSSNVVIAKRKLGDTNWEIRKTQYTGDTRDAHKSISIAVDGKGFLHMVWNQHDSALQYCRSIRPGSLELSDKSWMLNRNEERVTYPEFYNLSDGDLLFLYRDGSSGRGNLVLNRYHVKSHQWSRPQDKLIDGENVRSAYWQAAVDSRGAIHISWVWRETPDVASNHDICYAKSVDGGRTWQKTNGDKYSLPITAASAEYVWRIPEHSELINQTSMATDALGRPYIVSYWTTSRSAIPQYHLLHHNGKQWLWSQITERKVLFSLSGVGTRRIPISRPQILINGQTVVVVFRDAERGERISIATKHKDDRWRIRDLTDYSVGMWEPTFDPVVWKNKKELHLFVQRVGQGEAEGIENVPAQMISVLEWKPTRIR